MPSPPRPARRVVLALCGVGLALTAGTAENAVANGDTRSLTIFRTHTKESASNPFIHLDVGSVRSWPKMSHDQLARLFPDGKTVHIPSDNRPMARYEEAKAEILACGGTVAGITIQLAQQGAELENEAEEEEEEEEEGE